MLAEKAYHLGGGVGTPRIGVGAAGTPSRPCMPRLVDNPPLRHGPAGGAMVDHAGVGMAPWHLSAFHRRVVRGLAGAARSGAVRLPPLVDQAIRVGRGDGRIAIP